MAIKFLEPGGDADFFDVGINGPNLWNNDQGGSWSVQTDFVHGGHLRSIFPNTSVLGKPGVLSDSGSRMSAYIYINTLPSSTSTFMRASTSGLATVVSLRLTSTGVLQIWDANGQIGSSGSTLSTGVWYRVSFAYTITSTTVNEFRVFLNGIQNISVSNATVANTGSDNFRISSLSSSSIRFSDIYVDDSSALTDTGDIWVTAKRPNANGSTTNFTTQIGSGGSGYGAGHTPQVNERPNSDSNGWSVVVTGSSITENYAIEGRATGDIDLSSATIVDYMGWIRAKSLTSETGTINLTGSSTNISLTSTTATFLKVKGSSTYPSGDAIGMTTATTSTTVSIYEAGIVVAYLAPSLSVSDSTAISESVTVTPVLVSTTISEPTIVSDTPSLVIIGTFSINKIEVSVVTDSVSVTLPTLPITLQVILDGIGPNGFVPGIKIIS